MITRRTLLTVAAASAIAGCTTRHQLVAGGSNGDGPASNGPESQPLPSSVVMIGDSITVASQTVLSAMFPQLGFSAVAVNAEKSRRIDVGNGRHGPLAGTSVARFVLAANKQPEVWVIALGTNDAGQFRDGTEYGEVIAHMLDVIPPTAALAWIDVYRRDYAAGSQVFNLVLRDLLAKRGRSAVGEWYKQCTAPGARLLGGDGVHPNKRGVLVFADTVRVATQRVMSVTPAA